MSEIAILREVPLPEPPPGCCPECGLEHPPEQPHCLASPYYQLKFMFTHAGRHPTWGDALAHCPDEVKSRFRQELRASMLATGHTLPRELREAG